jgi:hypothetical protein
MAGGILAHVIGNGPGSFRARLGADREHELFRKLAAHPVYVASTFKCCCWQLTLMAATIAMRSQQQQFNSTAARQPRRQPWEGIGVAAVARNPTSAYTRATHLRKLTCAKRNSPALVCGESVNR